MCSWDWRRLSRQSQLVLPLLQICSNKSCVRFPRVCTRAVFCLCNMTLCLSCTLFLGLLFILSSVLPLCLCEPVLIRIIELWITKDDIMNSPPLSTVPVLSCKPCELAQLNSGGGEQGWRMTICPYVFGPLFSLCLWEVSYWMWLGGAYVLLSFWFSVISLACTVSLRLQPKNILVSSGGPILIHMYIVHNYVYCIPYVYKLTHLAMCQIRYHGEHQNSCCLWVFLSSSPTKPTKVIVSDFTGISSFSILQWP